LKSVVLLNVNINSWTSEKLDHMSHDMVGMDKKLDRMSHTICEELSRLYTRLDSVKTNFGANSSNLIQNCPANQKARHVIDSIHELLEGRSRLLEGVSPQGAEPADGIARGGRADQLPYFINELSSLANELSDRINQLSNLLKQNKDNDEFESQPLWDIMDEIAALVENLKCVIREANSMEATWRQAMPHGRVADTNQRESRAIYIQNNYFAADLSTRPSPHVLPILPETTRKPFSLPVLPHGLGSPSSEPERCPIDIESDRRTWTGDVVVQHSSVLKTFFSPDRVCLADAAVRSAAVSKQTLARLTQWSRPDSPSQMLWIRGPYTPARNLENPLTRLAAKLAAIARQSSVPSVSYFCPLASQTPCIPPRQHGETTESAPLMALLYALIWQVVELLPPLFESEMDLSAELFERLAREQLMWEDVFVILKDMVALVPEPIFCILEGVQRLEQSNIDSYLSKFITVLREVGGGMTRMHVLLVTTGTSSTLRDAIPTNETCAEEYLSKGGFKEDLARHSDKFWI
jgi:hypothetical protein